MAVSGVGLSAGGEFGSGANETLHYAAEDGEVVAQMASGELVGSGPAHEDGLPACRAPGVSAGEPDPVSCGEMEPATGFSRCGGAVVPDDPGGVEVNAVV